MTDKECDMEQSACPCGDVNQVGFQLKKLDLMFRRNMEAHFRKSGFEGMSVINVWIIEYLAHNDNKNIFQKDIEKRFNIGKSSIAGTLKGMEEKGIIVRQSVEGDARLKKVVLTDKGRHYACKMEQGKADMEQKVSAGISEEDMDHFFMVIKQMQENLK